MMIKRVETLEVTIPLDRPIRFATRRVKEREFSIVKIFTDNDLEGLGVSAIGDASSVSAFVKNKLAKILIGEDPFNYERIWHICYREVYRDRQGAAIRALSAVDIAVWDLIGKALKIPLHRLLGGYRDTIPAYASGGYYREGEGIRELVREMNSYLDMGYKAVKMKVGAVSIRRDVERVKAVRETVGPDVKVMIDANNAYSSYDAIRAGREFGRHGIYWFEEPVWPEDLRGSRMVAEALDTPVAAGELVFTRYGFRDLILNGAVDIIQPDATVVGGVTEWMKVTGIASTWHIPVSPHWNQEIHMHLAAAIPNVLWVEFFVKGGDVRKEDLIYEEYVEPKNGLIKLPSSPGFGRHLDEEAIKKYSKDMK